MVLNPRARVVAVGKDKEEEHVPIVAPVAVPAPIVAVAPMEAVAVENTEQSGDSKKKKKGKSNKGWLPVPARRTVKAH